MAAAFSAVQVGDPFDPATQMGPLAMERQRDRVEDYIAKGIEEGATLVTGGGRPEHLDRGYYIEPTVFSGVDNKHVIAREEIFGPVLSVIPADNDEHAVDIANDTIYGLNASVFTPDVGPRPRSRRAVAFGHRGPQRDADRLRRSPSVASSNPGSAAKAGAKACCRTWRPRRFCSTRRLRSTHRKSRDYSAARMQNSLPSGSASTTHDSSP